MAENSNQGIASQGSVPGEFGEGRQTQGSSQSSAPRVATQGSLGGQTDAERPLTVQNERGGSSTATQRAEQLGDGSPAITPGASATAGTPRRTGTRARGFASMDPAKQRAIASKGGRAAHAKGTAHEWSSDEARNAGRKGGEAVSRDRAHMSAIGREGGEASRGSARRNRNGSSNGSDIGSDNGASTDESQG